MPLYNSAVSLTDKLAQAMRATGTDQNMATASVTYHNDPAGVVVVNLRWRRSDRRYAAAQHVKMSLEEATHLNVPEFVKKQYMIMRMESGCED